MADVVSAIKLLHQEPVPELKKVIFDIFKGNLDFQKRFLEFLPETFRS